MVGVYIGCTVAAGIAGAVATVFVIRKLFCKQSKPYYEYYVEDRFSNLRIYQIMVSSFQGDSKSKGYGTGYGPSNHNGTLRGIIDSLDYIKGLNVNAIWLTPIFDSTGGFGGPILQSTGYFCTNYFKIDPHFGDENTFRELVRECHNRGMFIFLDGVFGHHGGVKEPSPNGNTIKGSNPVSYPGSLSFYKEVAQFWIDEFGIDGWRLDQCYQMFQYGHNYMHEIRKAIESVCERRKAAGEEWGILGYVVGEHWGSTEDINHQTYSQDGLLSAFDFPARYKLVQTIASNENREWVENVNLLAQIYKSPFERGYWHSSGSVFPNLFIGNHDTWRLGNLIRQRFGYGRENPDYYKRYKLAISCLCAFSGPITLYYGEESGDITEIWNNSHSHLGGSNVGSDNCARTNGQIKDFSREQQDLHDFTAQLMKIRREHPALYRGTNSVQVHNNDQVLVNCKWDNDTYDKVVFVINISTVHQTVYYDLSTAVRMKNLIDGTNISGVNGWFGINLGPLESRFFKVN